MSEIDDIRQSLRMLGRRLAEGEIDEVAYDRLHRKLLADLSPAERAELGTGITPAPASPRSLSGAKLGPSGSSGRGLATRIASLSDLDLRPGAVLFAQWRIERELGRGGFGVVVEAEDLTLQERQAVKVLDPAMVAREEFLERFRREVRATRGLVHPRIVRVFDYREDLPAGLALFSMEYVRGCSVQSLLAQARDRGRTLPVPLAATILVQVLEALEVAHAKGVVHRDVTPANILLAGGTATDLLADATRDPQVKLVDFGIAGAVDRSELSQKSRVLGTAAYVAPEVLDPRGEVTGAADIYGAGAVFYELLTGEMPLGRFEDPSSLRPDVEMAVDVFALSLLERQPAQRPSAKQAKEKTLALLQDASRKRDEQRQEEEWRRHGRVADEAAARKAAETARRAEEARRGVAVQVGEYRAPVAAEPPARVRPWLLGVLLVGLIGAVLYEVSIGLARRPAPEASPVVVVPAPGEQGSTPMALGTEVPGGKPNAEVPLSSGTTAPLAGRDDWNRATKIVGNSGTGFERTLAEIARELGTASLPMALDGSESPPFVTLSVERLDRLAREADTKVSAYTIPGSSRSPPVHIFFSSSLSVLNDRQLRPTFLRATGGSVARTASQLEGWERYGVDHVADLNGDGLADWLLSSSNGNYFVGSEVGWNGPDGVRSKQLHDIVHIWSVGGGIVLESGEWVRAENASYHRAGSLWPRIFQWNGSTFADASDHHPGYYETVFIPEQEREIERCRKAIAAEEDPSDTWARPSIPLHERLIRDARKLIARNRSNR